MPSAAAAAAVAVAATRVVTAGAPETVAVNAYAPIVGPNVNVVLATPLTSVAVLAGDAMLPPTPAGLSSWEYFRLKETQP